MTIVYSTTAKFITFNKISSRLASVMPSVMRTGAYIQQALKQSALACSLALGLVGAILFQASAAHAAAPSAKISTEAFAALPTFSQAKLSPSGKKIAFSISIKGRKHIVVQGLSGENPKVIAPSEQWDLNTYQWANENVIVLSSGSLLNRREFSSKTYNTRALSFIIDEGKYVWLGKPKKALKTRSKSKGVARVSQVETILDYLPSDPDHILLELDFDIDGNSEVFKVNVKTGRRKNIRKEVTGIQNWYTDQNSTIRLGTGYKGVKYDQPYAIFKQPDGTWSSLKNVEWWDKYNIRGFSADPNVVYVSGKSKYGTSGLYKLDVSTGHITDTVFQHEDVDVGSLVYDPITGVVIGVAYTDDFYRIKYFDKTFRIVQSSMKRAFKGAATRIASRAKDKQLYLIYTQNTTNPGDYYLYDRAAKKVHFIAPVYDKIDIEKTALTESISIPVRDGSQIPAYITVPKNQEAKNLPTVILPHGGPHARDTAEWDFWSQFYANRGYLVLKPNFRGSTGYGQAYRSKGVKQWGGLMQNDVTDATRWLIDQGMSDPDRICIVGASYGGYAAMMGPIMEPGLYKCAISINGVPNLLQIKTNDKKTIGGNVWIKNMGLKGADDKMVSPYHRAKEMSAPILLMSSVDDARIPFRMSKSMHTRLKKLKKPSKYVQIDNGGHSMITEAARLKMLSETEKFLAKHIGN